MSNLFGLPMEVISGLAAGSSAAFFITFEMDSDSELAKFLFKSRMRSIISSSSVSFTVGYLVSPIAGLMTEIIVYPACWFKSRKVKRALEMLDTKLKPGEDGYIKVNNKWTKVTKKLVKDKNTSAQKSGLFNLSY